MRRLCKWVIRYGCCRLTRLLATVTESVDGVERGPPMTDPVEEFFNGLAQRGYEPLLQHNSGSIRFDLKDGDAIDHWRVTIDQGKLAVGRDDAAADTVVIQDRATLVDAIQGKQNVMIALGLGQIGVSGDIERLVSFQRLFGKRPEMATTRTGRR
jgi:putative sterol carrier protein